MPGDGERRRDYDTGFYRAVDSLQKSAEGLSHTVALVDKNQAVLEERLNGHTENIQVHRALGEPPCSPLKTHIDGHKKYTYLMVSTLLGMIVTLILAAGALLIQLSKESSNNQPKVVAPPK